MRRSQWSVLVLAAGLAVASQFGPVVAGGSGTSAVASVSRTAGADDETHLRIGVTTYGPETWDPINADAATANSLHGLVFDWLVGIEEGKPVPGVLESFESSDDGLYWDLRMREGLTFHDGSPATVEDLEFTFDRYRSEEAFRSQLRNAVDRTEVIDDLTLRVHLNEPFPYFPYFLASTVPHQGSLMPKAYIEEHGLDYFLEHPIGVGPWRLESFVVGDAYHYTAVEDHWRKSPAFDRLSVLLIPELDTQLALLRTGELDVVYVALDDVADVADEGFAIHDLIPFQVRIDIEGAYDPRAEGMPTADIRVREALFHAIDYDEIAAALFQGRALPRVPPRTLYGQDEVDPAWTERIENELFQYDPELSRELLAEAGYPDGFDLDVFVSQPEGVSYMNDLAVAVQAYWSEVGVNANLVQLELAEYRAIRGPVDRVVGTAVFATGGILAPPPNNLEWIWGSAGGAAKHARVFEDGTREVYLPELDELLYGSMTELDPQRRAQLIDDTIEMGLNTYTTYVFGEVPSSIAVSPSVHFEEFVPPVAGGWSPAYAENASPVTAD